MNNEQKYLFDLQGYIVLKNVVPKKIIESIEKLTRDLLNGSSSALSEPASIIEWKDNDKSIRNIVEADTAFQYFIDIPEVIDIIQEISGDTFRLNHTYGKFWTGTGNYTTFHFHGTPLVPPASYRYHNDRIVSTLTKAVFPLLDCDEEDGCFAVIPGSHKSNFERPWGDHHHPEVCPVIEPVPGNAGDCIIFSEALSHGSTVNKSGKNKSTLYYCYSIGWMQDWDKELYYSKDVLEKLTTEKRRKIVKLKDPSTLY